MQVKFAKVDLSNLFQQGIVISTGPNSKFGEVFKMMQSEEVISI